MPYIVHPIGVANILANEANVDDIVVLQVRFMRSIIKQLYMILIFLLNQAALLHDTVEDTGTTLDEVRATFGDDVARVVDEVSDDKSLSKVERKRAQIAHALVISREAKLVKLADKLYNLRDLRVSAPRSWSPARVVGYFVWARFVVDGMRGTNSHLESELDSLFATVIPPQPSLQQQLDEYLSGLQDD